MGVGHDHLVDSPLAATPRPSTSDAIRGELLATVAPDAADERVLVELAASAAAIAFDVEIAAGQLAKVLPLTLSEPDKARAIARVLHDLAAIGNVLVRRVEGALTVASTLRVQRRLREGPPR